MSEKDARRGTHCCGDGLLALLLFRIRNVIYLFSDTILRGRRFFSSLSNSVNQSVKYIHVVNLFYSDDDLSLYLSASELEQEDDEGVPDLPDGHSVIIN